MESKSIDTNDITVKIATGGSRTAIHWDNVTMSWADLVARCSRPVRTAETVAEFAAMSRDAQGRIKDVGGFVGGHLRDGVRKGRNVLLRSVLTLDADTACPDLLDKAAAVYPGTAMMIYTTHKHRPEAPRMRLLIPLGRDVSAEEYEAVSRMVAYRIGEDYFDQSTYSAPRLMYWASVSADGEFVAESREGAPLDPDSIIDGLTERPAPLRLTPPATSAASTATVSTAEPRPGDCPDPRLKPGTVGAFCRVYDIASAIARYLPDVFVPAGPGRYTYNAGTTTGGAVVYDGLWLYSHHDTDPYRGRLLNAYDLVRLHLYGDLDPVGAGPTDPATPSVRAMYGLVTADPAVCSDRDAFAADLTAAGLGDIDIDDETGADGAPKADDWRDLLKYSPKGAMLETAANVITILENDPDYAGRLWHDDFAGIDRVAPGGLKWNPAATEWTNADDARLRVDLESRYNITRQQRIDDGLTEVFQRHRRHPVREYLDGLQWDGTPRVDRVIIDYLGADDNQFNRAVTRLHLTASVARVMEPGCKYDYCLVLSGAEGVGKSSLFSILYGQWHNDSLDALDGKGAMEQIQGSWCVELGELGAIKRTEVESVKRFITAQHDTFRAAYDRRVERHPRQCVFAATTNETNFLRSTTGNRRFNVITILPELAKWPTVAGRLGALAADRDQIWAEAVKLYRDGVKLYLPADMADEARRRQEEHSSDANDPVRDRLAAYLEAPLPLDWEQWTLPRRRAYFNDPDPLQPLAAMNRTAVCPVEFLCEACGVDLSDMRRQRTLVDQVSRYLADMGWERGTKTRRVERLYGRQTDWRPSPILSPTKNDR